MPYVVRSTIGRLRDSYASCYIRSADHFRAILTRNANVGPANCSNVSSGNFYTKGRRCWASAVFVVVQSSSLYLYRNARQKLNRTITLVLCAWLPKLIQPHSRKEIFFFQKKIKIANSDSSVLYAFCPQTLLYSLYWIVYGFVSFLNFSDCWWINHLNMLPNHLVNWAFYSSRVYKLSTSGMSDLG